MARDSFIRGDRELIAALKNLASGVAVSDIDRAASTALKPMLNKTKSSLKANRNFKGKYPGFPQPKSPRKGGHVDQGVIVRRDSTSNKTKRSYKLGATKRARHLLHLVEFGTAPHYQPNFRGGFMHPGATPKPALTPAYEEHKDDVIQSFSDEIVESLERRAKGLGMRTRRTR